MNSRILAIAIITAVIGSTLGIVGLGSRVRDLEAQVVALVDLQELQSATHSAILGTIENQLTAIEANTQADQATFEAIENIVYIIEVYREDHVESVAEIYQGHIIPLRSFHMEDNLHE